MAIQDANNTVGIGGKVERLVAAYLAVHAQYPLGSSVLFAPLHDIFRPKEGVDKNHLHSFRNIFGDIRSGSWQALRDKNWDASDILIDTRALLVDAKLPPTFQHNFTIDIKRSFSEIFCQTLELVLKNPEDDRTIRGMEDLICFVAYTGHLNNEFCPLPLGQCRFGEAAGVWFKNEVAQGSADHKTAWRRYKKSCAQAY